MPEDAALLLEVMRRHRHDFLNHLQVVSGFLQLGKVDRALEYIRRVSGEMEKLGAILRLKYPQMATLLLKNSLLAQDKQIDLDLDLATDLHSWTAPDEHVFALSRRMWENIIRAMEDLPAEQRKITCSLEEDAAVGRFRISFSLPAIGWSSMADWQTPRVSLVEDRQADGLRIIVEWY